MKQHDYEALAKAIKENTAEVNLIVPMIFKFDFILSLCDILAADNKNFNKEKFMEDCK